MTNTPLRETLQWLTSHYFLHRWKSSCRLSLSDIGKIRWADYLPADNPTTNCLAMPLQTRSSGLSFDSGPSLSAPSPRESGLGVLKGSHPTYVDPDKPISSAPTFLNRNKTERNRLQGLARVLSTGPGTMRKAPFDAQKELGLGEKARIWMVNQGDCPVALFWLICLTFCTHSSVSYGKLTARSNSFVHARLDVPPSDCSFALPGALRPPRQSRRRSKSLRVYFRCVSRVHSTFLTRRAPTPIPDDVSCWSGRKLKISRCERLGTSPPHRRHLHPLPRVPKPHLAAQTNAAQLCHRI
jgi:hypothetical protein